MAVTRQTILRHRPVRRLWLASATTAVAVWSVQIAVTVEVLRHHSVATLAVVGLIGSLPALVLLPVAGTCADRYGVRRLALLVVAAQAACLGLLGLVAQHGLVLLTALYAVQGGLAAFWPPARQQWLYGVVTVELRHPANAAIGSINGIMTLIGAAFGGLLSAWHPVAAILAAAALQLVTLVVLAGVPARATPADGAVGAAGAAGADRPGSTTDEPARRVRVPLLHDLVDGVRAAASYPLARSVIWIGIAWGLIGGGYNVLLAGHITEDLHGGSITLGLVYAVDGLSVIVATALASHVPRARHLPVYGAAYVVQGVGWALAFAASTLPLTIAALILMRLASGYIIALDTTILLETVPARLRGRIASVHMTTYNAVARISLAALGVVLASFSIGAVGIATGAASAAFGLAWWRWSGRPAVRIYRSAATTTELDKRSLESTS